MKTQITDVVSQEAIQNIEKLKFLLKESLDLQTKLNLAMTRYTKEQLIEAQTMYNIAFRDNPEKFADIQDNKDNPEQAAVGQIEYLLSLVR